MSYDCLTDQEKKDKEINPNCKFVSAVSDFCLSATIHVIYKTANNSILSLTNIAVTTPISQPKPSPPSLPQKKPPKTQDFPINQLTIMRHGAHYTPPALLSPFPAPALNSIPTAGSHHPMLLSVFLALFLPFVGMSAVFIVYICLLWYATNYQTDNSGSLAAKQVAEKGLSVSELEKLPKVTGKELVLGTECAVCLDEIEAEQPARMVPGCNHGFHLQCADTWLSKHSICPVCRTKLEPQLFDASDDNPC